MKDNGLREQQTGRGRALWLDTELWDMLREDAVEQDMTIKDVATVYITFDYKPKARNRRRRLDWAVLAARRKIDFYVCVEVAERIDERGTVTNHRDVPTVVSYKNWRLEYQPGEEPPPGWHRQPGGNPRRNLKGWYLVGPGLSDTHHMWMGMVRCEAERAAVPFITEAQARL